MSIQQMAENVSQKTDRFIAENGGSVRDALIVALARLEWAEWEISQLKSAQQMFAPDPPMACPDCGSVDKHIHYANCPLANTAGR